MSPAPRLRFSSPHPRPIALGPIAHPPLQSKVAQDRMSYRTFKRVLGETSLERKCRWWFGISLIVLLSLSFTWYGRRTNHIVYDLNRIFLGPELVRAGWLEVHF